MFVDVLGANPAIRYIFYVRRGGHKRMPLLSGLDHKYNRKFCKKI